MKSRASWLAPDTLRQKLMLWVLTPMIVLLILNIGLIYKFGYDNADSRIDRFLSDSGSILLDQLRADPDGKIGFFLNSGASEVLYADQETDQVYFSIRGVQGGFKFGDEGLPPPPDRIGRTPISYFSVYKGMPVRIMAGEFSRDDLTDEDVVLMVAKTLNLHDRRSVEWLWRILPSLIFLTVCAGVMVWWGVGKSLHSLTSLRDELARRSSHDLHPLPEDKVVSEVRPLIQGLNELMLRLDEAFKLKRRFIADAAHQLRTPLSGLKVQAELARQMEGPARIALALQQIQDAADHAAHLANQLLLLSHAEPGEQLRMHELDLAALARNSTERWVPGALKKQIDIGLDCGLASCRITGNPLLLGEMLNNLIDNALRYTPSGGQITVRIIREEEKVRLEVQDNGPGITEAERERVFERFYRVLGTNQEGCGLGLPIVREIASRHHAEVYLSSGPNGLGTTVSVLFFSSKRPEVGLISGIYPKMTQPG